MIAKKSRNIALSLPCEKYFNVLTRDIDREFVTSAKKFANFNEFSEIKKFVKIRKKFVKCPSGGGLPTTTEEYDAFHGFMLIKI